MPKKFFNLSLVIQMNSTEINVILIFIKNMHDISLKEKKTIKRLTEISLN